MPRRADTPAADTGQQFVAARPVTPGRAAPRTTGSWSCRTPGRRTGRTSSMSASNAVAGGQGATLRYQPFEPAELHQPDGRLHIGHPVVVASLQIRFHHRLRAGVPIGGRRRSSRVRAADAAAGLIRIVRGDHPALTGGEQLARVGTTRPRSANPYRPADRSRWNRRRRRRPPPRAIPSRSAAASRRRRRSNGTPLPGAPRSQRRCGVCERPRPFPRSGCRVVRSTSANTGWAPTYTGRVRGGDERQGRHDDLITDTYPRRDERQMQPGGAGTRPRRRARARPRASELLLELGDPRTLGHPTDRTASAAARASSSRAGTMTWMRLASLIPVLRPLRSWRHQVTRSARPRRSLGSPARKSRRSAAADVPRPAGGSRR